MCVMLTRSVQLLYMHSSLETKKYPYINSYRRHSTQSIVFARTFVRISMNSRSAIDINLSKRSIYLFDSNTRRRKSRKYQNEWGIFFPFFKRNESAFITHAHVSVRTNCRVVSTWFTIYIQLPKILKSKFQYYFSSFLFFLNWWKKYVFHFMLHTLAIECSLWCYILVCCLTQLLSSGTLPLSSLARIWVHRRRCGCQCRMDITLLRWIEAMQMICGWCG